MAITADQFTTGMINYVATLNTLIDSINTEDALRVAKSGLDANLTAASAYKITNLVNGTGGSQDSCTVKQAEDLVAIGALPGLSVVGNADKFLSTDGAGSEVWLAMLNSVALGASQIIAPTQYAVKTYVDAKISNKVADWNIPVGDCSGSVTYTNLGDTGTAIGTLPAGFDGAEIDFLVVAGYTLRSKAQAGEYIRYLGGQSISGGYVESAQVDTHWKLKWNGDDSWVVVQRVGYPDMV